MSTFVFIPSANLGWSVDYRSILWRNIILLLSLLVTGCTSRNGLYETEGPNFFTHEPQMLNYFTHDKGLTVHCSARGSTISWMNAVTHEPISSINGLRQILINGSIFYPPFSTTFYRPDVHNSTIYCLASNQAGQIRSRDIYIRAVINQRQEIHPQDTYLTIGNDALLNCLIPESIKDFVSVTSWIKDSSFNIFPHSGGGGGRYYMLPSGQLLIEGASSNDSVSTFHCRTVNRLTGKTLESETSARLRLRGGESKTEPRIVGRGSGSGSGKVTETIRLKEGESGVLLCLSEADPAASQVWQKADGFGGFENLRQSERIRIRKSTVIIENVGQHDAGLYLCICSNPHGSARLQLHVIVQSPLTVQVLPSVMTADVGKSVEFSCWTNSQSGQKDHGSSMVDSTTSSNSASGSGSEWTKIKWYKNGKELTASTRIAFSSFNKLRIAYVQREDFGMIQCFVLSPTDMSQAAAQLRLDDASPHFIYRFIEQTLQPGQPVSLKCTAAGNPTPRVKWLLDGFVPPISERVLIGQYVRTSGDVVSHLNISRVDVHDGGEYSCLVDNGASIDGTPLIHSARLNIYGPPFIRNMPPVTAIERKTFTIKCPAAGFPLEWPIVWEKDGQLLPMSRRQTVTQDGILTIRDVDRKADVGRYTCIIHNKQGLKDQKSVQINVVVAPKVSFNFPKSVSMGERLVVICVVSEGDIPIDIKWLKDSQPISSMDGGGSSSSQRVTVTRDDFDLALRINSVSPSDAGEYSCTSANAFGEASFSAPLVVQVPPRIAPFFFPSSVQVHQRAQVICALQEGDPYMTSIRWLKNGESLSSAATSGSFNKMKIIEVQRDMSLLIIDSVESEDNGNYTCLAQGDIEGLTDSVTAPLVVRVPPQWRVEPTDQMILSGDNLKLPCQAEGFPVPNVSWKKQMGNRAGNYQDIPIQGVNAKSLLENVVSDVNGTLFIRPATKKNEGSYLCEANNGIGAGLSRKITVTVNVPVKIKDKSMNTTTRVRTNAVLQCRVNGDGPIEVTWRSSQLDSSNLALDPRYYIQTTANSSGGGVLSELKINNVIRDDSKNGPFTCYASNSFGKDHANFWLLVKDVPEAPRELSLISKGSRFLRIGWALESSLYGNSPIIQFTIKHFMDKKSEPWSNTMDSSPSTMEINVPGNMFSETIRNLQPATTYHISVFARNEIGSSGPSETLQVMTDGEPPPPPVIQAVPVSSSEIKIMWDHKDDVPNKILGYYVGFRRHREEEQYQFSTVDVTVNNNMHRSSSSSLSSSAGANKMKETSRREYFLSNLIAYTSYEIVIQGFNSFGVGALSEPPVITNTLEDVPISAPEGLMCATVNSQNIKLSFQSLMPTQARGIITGYKIYMEKTDPQEMDDDVIVRTTLATTTVVTGLQPWTNYSVQVAGLTRVGEGVHSTSIQCQTDEDVPGKLEAIKSVTKSPTSCIVSWLPPRKKNGQLINYVLYVFDGNGSHNSGRNANGIKKKTILPTLDFFEVEGLKTNEKYEFRVAAVSSKGEGKASITHQIPTKNFGAAIVTIGQEFLVVWKADVRLPCKVVGDPMPLLEWNRSAKVFQENERMMISSDGSLWIRDAQKEDQGEYICVVKNIRGSESINHSLFVQVPPPEPLLHTTSSTHNSIFIMWKLLDDDKFSLKGYILHLKVRDEWIERRLSRHMNSYEVTDLECGNSYQLYLTGYNGAGIGKASNILKNVTTLGSPPSIPVPAEMMIQVNTTWIRVKLDSWLENGCPIIQCRVLFRQQDQQTRWQTLATEVNFNSQAVDLVGLKPSTAYIVRIICRNSAGENEVDVNARTLPWHDEQVGLENSKDLSNKSPMWKTDPGTTTSTAFYLDWKLMGPIVLSSLAILMAGGGLCLCLKKKPHSMGRSMEHLSGGTPSSSTYFKGNQRSAPHPLYMTVKKATPLKGADLANMDHIPQYSEDIYPYATFELNEPNIRRDSRFNAPTTGAADRNRSNSNVGQNRKSSTHSGGDNFCNAKFYDDRKADESEEYDYDSIDSDSELGNCKVRPGEFFIEYREPVETKCQDFEFSHSSHRCSNQYEFVPSNNHLFHHRLKSAGKSKNNQPHCDDATSTFSVPKQFSKKQKNRMNIHQYDGTGKAFNSNQIEPPSTFSDVKSVANDSIAV